MELSDAALRHLQTTLERPIAIGSRYQIAEEIGRGGMGSVYRAFDRELERDVAVKVLSRAELDPRAMERLKREARIAARLEHPGIVPVYDVGALDDGRPYYVMKLVGGARLDELIASSASKDERIDVFLKICDAVAYAHSSGVVHRDLKPENVRVGAFGEVQVLDFGVAKLLAADERARETPDSAQLAAEAGVRAAIDPAPMAAQAPGAAAIAPRAPASSPTARGAIVGTPGWMAPEQARGASDVDARADVHALGALLAELLKPVEVERRRALAAIVAKATANERDRRYARADELADDVRRWRAGEAVSALPEGPLARGWRLAGRHRVALVLVLAYVVMRVLLALLGPRFSEAEGRLGMIERVGEVRVPSGTLTVIDPCNLGTDSGHTPVIAVEQRIADLPRDRALVVEGLRLADEPDYWEHVAVRISDAPIASSVHLGDVPVDTARLLFGDGEIAAHWVADESLDGKSDVAFWGRDEELLARATGAPRLPEGTFGWADLSVDAAEERSTAARALQAEHGWMVMIDYRPHTHDWALLAQARSTPTASGTLDIGELRVCLAMVNQGDGSYGVYADRAADGSLVRVRVQLHREG